MLYFGQVFLIRIQYFLNILQFFGHQVVVNFYQVLRNMFHLIVIQWNEIVIWQLKHIFSRIFVYLLLILRADYRKSFGPLRLYIKNQRISIVWIGFTQVVASW